MRAPVSRVLRARDRSCDEADGVGRRQFRCRRVILALDSRDAVSGEVGDWEVS